MNTKIQLPKKFEEIIKGSHYEVALGDALQNFSKLLDQSGGLFPEYTDHSSDHIQDVLNSAENIITEQSFQCVTPEDVYVLTIAICLHDCGMTLGWSELKAIISDKKYNGKVFSYRLGEEKNWAILWSEFKDEFRNFTPDDLSDIVGDKINLNGQLSDHFPDLDEENLTVAQLKVAGEFVRRHHARIAHVIAVFGYPNMEVSDVFHSSAREHDNFAGLVARSHHESLRSMYDRLQDNHRLEHRKCHLIFLMAVLRIADLMQITSKRTPLIIYKSKIFWSSVSQREWERHLSMLGYRAVAKDPSCISFEISATLTSVKELHSIRTLLNYFQLELDKLWAVMGEAYGENSVLSALKIKYRRVESDLDHKQYVEDLPFIDVPAEFRVDLSLIGKLITPLYGNVPEVGVRELLQNGLDSVRERRYLDPTKDYKVKVCLEKQSDETVLKVIDEGCGMDANIIRNYFLNIGSSFRQSKQWATNFSDGNKAAINRSGRFGIGMLAGFILGDEISVVTRRYDEAEPGHALAFSITLGGGLIQLDRVPLDSEQIGTTISIKLKPEVDKHLRGNPAQWQWYFHLDNDYQEVEYLIDNALHQNSVALPEAFWRPVSRLEGCFSKFKWGNNNIGTVSNNMLFVNSLKISSAGGGATAYKQTLDTYDNEPKTWGFDVLFPPVALDDPDLNLPLNLERNGFSEDTVSFGEELYNDVITTYLQRVHEFSDGHVGLESGNRVLNGFFYGLNRNPQAGQQCKSQLGLWGVHEKGFLFSDISLLKAANVEKIYIISPFLDSSSILKCCPENSAVFKLINEPQFHNQYRPNGGTIYGEGVLLSTLKNHAFLRGIFGHVCGLETDSKPYSLFLNKDHYGKIDISNVIKQNNITVNENDSTVVELSFSESVQKLNFPLNDRGIIVCIDISLLSDSKPKNQLSKRWLAELNSPFLNKDTKKI